MKRHRSFCVSLVFILLLFTAYSYAQTPKRKPAPKPKTPVLTIRGDTNVTVYGGDTPVGMNPAEKRRWESFIKVWETLNNEYFDQTFNNLDWYKIKADFRPRVVAAKTDPEFHALMQEMIGLLNRSHFAIVPPEVYIEIQRAKTEAKKREKLRREQEIADGADPENIPETDSLIDESKFKFGTGIELRLVKGKFMISRVDKDSAAEYAGVRAGFLLEQINGVSLSDMYGRAMIYYSRIKNIERHIPKQIVDEFLNGEKDSTVNITCLDGEDKPVEFKIRREKLRGQSVSIGPNYPEQFLRFETRSLSDDVGYIGFNLFALPIVEKYCDAISEFKDKKALVIDLRGNFGGLIGTIYALSGMLTEESLDMGTSIYKVGSERIIAKSKAKNFKGRVVFLVDNQTISAAEIFSAGVRENGRALLVGETTAGEALPSITTELPTGAIFIYPIANFKTVKGTFLEGSGVTPDFAANLDRKALLEGKDSQLDKALSLIAEDKAFPTKTERLMPPIAVQKVDAPPAKIVGAPTPRPAPKVYQGDNNSGIGSGPAKLSDGPSSKVVMGEAKTIQSPPTGAGIAGNARPPSIFKSSPPSIFTTEIVPSKDARSLQIISQFVEKIGGEARWTAIRSYQVAGRNVTEIKGSKTEWDFNAYRLMPDSYAVVLSSPTVGDIRQIYTNKEIIVQTDFGTEESIPIGGGAAESDFFNPIDKFVKGDSFQSLSYQGIFDRDGRKCHVIEARAKSGETIGLAFDVETKLLVSYAARSFTVTYGDYRKVGTLLFPFLIDIGRAGKVLLDMISIDQTIDPAVFRKKENCFDRPNN